MVGHVMMLFKRIILATDAVDANNFQHFIAEGVIYVVRLFNLDVAKARDPGMSLPCFRVTTAAFQSIIDGDV